MKILKVLLNIKNEAGMTLIEVLVALAILGIIAAAVPSGLMTASKAVKITDDRTTVETLAISQMEHTKKSPYIDFSEVGHGDYELISASEGYSVEVVAVPIYSDNGTPVPSGEDLGLQMITATASHVDGASLTFETYKVAR